MAGAEGARGRDAGGEEGPSGGAGPCGLQGGLGLWPQGGGSPAGRNADWEDLNRCSRAPSGGREGLGC